MAPVIQQWLRVQTAVKSLFYTQRLNCSYTVDVCLEPMFCAVDNFTRALGPFFVAAGCALTASVVVIAYWLGLPYWWDRSPWFTVVLVVVGHWLLVNVCFHYYMGTVTPPGFPPDGDLIPEAASICKKCIAPKPPRTHHCSVCNRCILKMDHHCPWLNNCVGHYNHRYYFLYIVYVVISALFLMVFGLRLAFEEAILAYGYWMERGQDPLHEDQTVAINDTMMWKNLSDPLHEEMPISPRAMRRRCIFYSALLLAAVSTALGTLGLWHARLIGRGETSIEASMSKAEKIEMAGRNECMVTKFDKAAPKNWKVASFAVAFCN